MSEKGFGVVFQYTTDGGTTWTALGDVKDATPPSFSKDVYETTNHGNANGHKTFKGALVEMGDASVQVQYDPADAGHIVMRTRALAAHEEPQDYRFIMGDTNTTVEEFSAILTGFEVVTPIGSEILANLTFKPSGTPTQNPV